MFATTKNEHSTPLQTLTLTNTKTTSTRTTIWPNNNKRIKGKPKRNPRKNQEAPTDLLRGILHELDQRVDSSLLQPLLMR